MRNIETTFITNQLLPTTSSKSVQPFQISRKQTDRQNMKKWCFICVDNFALCKLHVYHNHDLAYILFIVYVLRDREIGNVTTTFQAVDVVRADKCRQTKPA